MDILQQQRQAGALYSNDAKLCYNRTVHNIATLAMRRTGMPPEPIRSMFETLQKAERYAFVDDTDVIQSACNVNQTGEDVVPQIQLSVNRWEGGLQATGGAHAPSKSHWYLIDFIWTGKAWQYRTGAEMPGELSILDTNGQQVILVRHKPSEATETLGVWQAMDGNNTKQIAQLLKKT